MKVYLLKDVEKVGMAREIVKVSDGFAVNFLIPNKLAKEIKSDKDEAFYQLKTKAVENRKEAIATVTSMLAEKIKNTSITLKRKLHDNDKLYGAITAAEIVSLLAEKGISVSKSQVEFDKSIKTKGSHDVIIKLSSRLQPVLKLKIISEI